MKKRLMLINIVNEKGEIEGALPAYDLQEFLDNPYDLKDKVAELITKYDLIQQERESTSKHK